MASIVAVLFLSVFIIGYGGTAEADRNMTPEGEYCFQCHAKEEVRKEFANGEYLSVYVDKDRYSLSVHSFLKCSDCHRGFSPEHHPKRRFRNIEQYRLRSSHLCRRCHSDEEIGKRSIHAGLLKKEREGISPLCADCHSAHEVMPISGSKRYMSEEKYCLGCHAYDMYMRFKNEQDLSLRVDSEDLDGSVHAMLGCTDCHFGFSSEEHPQRQFRTRRDYLVATSENCRRCHFDKYSKTLESIHFATLSKGDMSAPVCTDCHGSHGIRRLHEDHIAITRRCRSCHAAVYDTYARSIHGDSLIHENNRDVPVCVDCHMAHEIRNPLAMEWHERIPEMCGKCHSDREMMGKYGLSTNVVTSYLSDFHGITLQFYKEQREKLEKPARPIAVCTDCHGTHSIISMKGIEITELKRNLLSRCRKCHEDVNENFPDAWLSHYEPSLASAPMVFMVNMFYKIFIPFLVIGLILQILLHIWRYSFNR